MLTGEDVEIKFNKSCERSVPNELFDELPF